MFGYKKVKTIFNRIFHLGNIIYISMVQLKYYALLTISRGQDFSWSCSIELDCNPHEHVDSENLAETFIAKLFSEDLT